MHPARLAALLAALAFCIAASGPAPREPARRIVSLIPSLTEDLFAIGAGDRVVAVSDYSDFPPAAKRLPRVATFASVSAERIVALHPDLVVGIPAQAAQVADLRRAGLRVVLLPDDSYEDLFRDLAVLGELSGRRAAADALAARLMSRAAALRRTVGAGRRPTVFVVLGDRPIYTVGNGSYIARLIALAGGENAAGDLRKPYGVYSAEALLAKQPDIVLVASDARFEAGLTRSPWRDLRAVRSHRIIEVPAHMPLARPGPRFTDALAWLIRTLRHAGGEPVTDATRSR